MTNETTIREQIEGIVQQIEASEYETARNNCMFLLEDHFRRLMDPNYPTFKTGSRSASPPSYGMDDFGRERVMHVSQFLKNTHQNLNLGNHIKAIESAKAALTTWNRGPF